MNWLRAAPNAGGKVHMVRAGIFDEVDASIMFHPAAETTMTDERSLAARGFEFYFHGKAAHAAGAPEEGINALDAVVAMYNAVSMLRQQVKSDVRIHGIILAGGAAANIIPDYAAIRYRTRSDDADYLEGVVPEDARTILDSHVTGCPKCTAFVASRVIGAFEGSIAKLAALAALMPIVAGIGGNSGNQTTTMIVRALALGQIQGGYWRKLLAKEVGVALLNGAVWGTLLGAIAYAFYGNVALGGVMALAMILNLLLAALMGVAIPWLRARFGRDPAAGSSVLITACTDSGGFFIFLGLATIFLV